MPTHTKGIPMYGEYSPYHSNHTQQHEDLADAFGDDSAYNRDDYVEFDPSEVLSDLDIPFIDLGDL